MKMQLISVNLGQNAERGSHATGIDVKLVYCFQKIYIFTSLSTVVTRYFLERKVKKKEVEDFLIIFCPKIAQVI